MHLHMIFVVTKIHWLKERWRHEGWTTFIGGGTRIPLDHSILFFHPSSFSPKIIDTSNPFLKRWKN